MLVMRFKKEGRGKSGDLWREEDKEFCRCLLLWVAIPAMRLVEQAR